MREEGKQRPNEGVRRSKESWNAYQQERRNKLRQGREFSTLGRWGPRERWLTSVEDDVRRMFRVVTTAQTCVEQGGQSMGRPKGRKNNPKVVEGSPVAAAALPLIAPTHPTPPTPPTSIDPVTFQRLRTDWQNRVYLSLIELLIADSMHPKVKEIRMLMAELSRPKTDTDAKSAGRVEVLLELLDIL